MHILVVTDHPIQKAMKITDFHQGLAYIQAGNTIIETIFVGDIHPSYIRGAKNNLVLLPESLKHDQEFHEKLYDDVKNTIMHDPKNNRIEYY